MVQKMTALIGLVSGTYNRLELLHTMVQSFRENIPLGMTYTITIVDGGSTDGTLDWCKAQSDMQLIEDGELLGAISAFTRGAHATDAKYILLANDGITFFPNSIVPAVVHLENNMRCGAVAFADNRPVASYTRVDYKVLHMEGAIPQGMWNPTAVRRTLTINGQSYMQQGIVYAQVGLFRKWLGDQLNWWLGEHEEMLGASVYGGDNSLSAQIWHAGYTVEAVPDCKVEDHIANDELRQINYTKGKQHDDSQYFYRQWPQGVIVNSEPQRPQQDRRAARILYLPIYEPGWTIQKHPVYGKHGLRDALARATNKFGERHIVQEFDYLGDDPKRLRQHLFEIVDSFNPDLLLTQIQAPLPITADILREIKTRTGATVVNWNGDQAPGGLASPEMLQLLRHVDLQLITNLDVVDSYEREHIKWAYWQIGYEDVGDDYEAKAADYYREIGQINPFDSNPRWPVVYLASLRSPERQAIAQIVRDAGGQVFTPGDIYGSLYNFSVTKTIYNRARIAISDNGFTSRGFVSNRLFQALAAGGCVVLQQHVDGLDELTGLQSGVHYIEWSDLHHLKVLISGALLAEDESLFHEIAKAGTAFVREHFSFDAQVVKLMALIKEKLGDNQQLNESVALRYIGRASNGFGLGNMWPSGQRYEYIPGRLLYVKREDADAVLGMFTGLFERTHTE